MEFFSFAKFKRLSRINWSTCSFWTRGVLPSATSITVVCTHAFRIVSLVSRKSQSSIMLRRRWHLDWVCDSSGNSNISPELGVRVSVWPLLNVAESDSWRFLLSESGAIWTMNLCFTLVVSTSWKHQTAWLCVLDKFIPKYIPQNWCFSESRYVYLSYTDLCSPATEHLVVC